MRFIYSVSAIHEMLVRARVGVCVIYRLQVMQAYQPFSSIIPFLKNSLKTSKWTSCDLRLGPF